MSGDEQTPWKGQSFARPAASLSCTACHRNWPSDSRNAITMPLSPLTFGSFIDSLFVPTSTTPLETTGLPYVCEPSSATHLMFFFVLMSHVVGSPFMPDTMLRSGVPPHIGQLPLPGSERAASARVLPSAASVNAAYAIFFIVISFISAREAPRVSSSRAPSLLIRIDLDVVVIHLRPAAFRGVHRIGVEARTALDAADRIDALDGPGGRLGF